MRSAPTPMHALHTASIRKFKTAFSPLASPSSNYSTISEMSTSPLSACSSVTSPGRRSTSSTRLSHFGHFANLSTISLNLRQNVRNLIKRSPSQVELEQEEERLQCGDELLGLIEPRPEAAGYVGGFEEVLFGRF